MKVSHLGVLVLAVVVLGADVAFGGEVALKATAPGGDPDIQVHKHSSGDFLKVSIALLHDDNFEKFAKGQPNLLVGFYSSKACRPSSATTAAPEGGQPSVSEKCDAWLRDFEDAVEGLKEAPDLSYALVDGSPEENGDEKSIFTSPTPFVSAASVYHKYVSPPFAAHGVPVIQLFQNGKPNTEVRLPSAAKIGNKGQYSKEIIYTLTMLTRPSSVGLYSIKAVEQAITNANHGHAAICIGFYEDLKTTNQFASMGKHFKDRGIIFFHVSGQETRQGFKDRNKVAILDHFFMFNTFVIFQHQTRDERRLLGQDQIRQQQGKPTTAATREAHKILEDLNPNFIMSLDKIVGPQHPLLKSDVGFYSKDPPGADSLFLKDGAFGKVLQQHTLSGIGLLTDTNKEMYARRTKGTVYIFLPVTPSNAVVTQSAAKSSLIAGSGRDEGEEGSIVLPAVGRNQRQREEQIRKVVEEVNTRYQLGATETKAIISTALLRLTAMRQFKDFTFLFVNPLEHPNLFASFGYDIATDVLPDAATGANMPPSDTSGWKNNMKPVLPSRKAPRATHAIGAAVVKASGKRSKFRYPESHLSPGLLEKFLMDIITSGGSKKSAPAILPYVRDARAGKLPDVAAAQLASTTGVLSLTRTSFQDTKITEAGMLVLFTNSNPAQGVQSAGPTSFFPSPLFAAASESLAAFAQQDAGKKLSVAEYDVSTNDLPIVEGDDNFDRTLFENGCGDEHPCLWLLKQEGGKVTKKAYPLEQQWTADSFAAFIASP